MHEVPNFVFSKKVAYTYEFLWKQIWDRHVQACSGQSMNIQNRNIRPKWDLFQTIFWAKFGRTFAFHAVVSALTITIQSRIRLGAGCMTISSDNTWLQKVQSTGGGTTVSSIIPHYWKIRDRHIFWMNNTWNVRIINEADTWTRSARWLYFQIRIWNQTGDFRN